MQGGGCAVTLPCTWTPSEHGAHPWHSRDTETAQLGTCLVTWGRQGCRLQQHACCLLPALEGAGTAGAFALQARAQTGVSHAEPRPRSSLGECTKTRNEERRGEATVPSAAEAGQSDKSLCCSRCGASTVRPQPPYSQSPRSVKLAGAPAQRVPLGLRGFGARSSPHKDLKLAHSHHLPSIKLCHLPDSQGKTSDTQRLRTSLITTQPACPAASPAGASWGDWRAAGAQHEQMGGFSGTAAGSVPACDRPAHSTRGHRSAAGLSQPDTGPAGGPACAAAR